jgi:Family of unknown function (DUF6352)
MHSQYTKLRTAIIFSAERKSNMKDFWLSCGHHLLDRDEGGGLVVTDEFLKLYLARPEIAPPLDACVVERTLHAALLADPRRPVGAADISAIADADARENWLVMIALRDVLVEHKTIEAAYLHLVRKGVGNTPPLFLDQLVHVILRNVLDGCDDAAMPRAAELFFRPQRLTTYDGLLIAADEETVAGAGAQSTSPLVSMLGLSAEAQIDILNDDNTGSYWKRSDLFDMALDLSPRRRGLAALGDVMARWLMHLLSVKVKIEPVLNAEEIDLSWYVGLDVEATRIGDALWNSAQLDQATASRVIGLYRITILDTDIVLDKARDAAIYLILATSPDGRLRMKPQNLVTGLPIRQLEAAS